MPLKETPGDLEWLLFFVLLSLAQGHMGRKERLGIFHHLHCTQLLVLSSLTTLGGWWATEAIDCEHVCMCDE
jgi:hypothetical protein